MSGLFTMIAEKTCKGMQGRRTINEDNQYNRDIGDTEGNRDNRDHSVMRDNRNNRDINGNRHNREG